MTISDLTNEQLDKLIAERRGEKVGLPHKENSLFHFTVIPSYTTDPRYAMELLKELPKGHSLAKQVSFVGEKISGWEISSIDSDYVICQADTPERAIAEAYATMKEGK